MHDYKSLGFVGLGVMGEPMCKNLVRKSALPVHVFDMNNDAVGRVVETGGIAAKSARSVAENADVVFLSLPSIDQVETVTRQMLGASAKPRMIVDMSTSDVARTRALAREVNAAGVAYVDAPVARTAEAAQKGTLMISVGGDERDFTALKPLLDCMGSDVLHCGPLGSGQILKILNNMMVFMTVNALSEVLTIGRRAGMDGEKLLQLLSQGSGDSFALRNHGMKSLVKDQFPEKVFPTVYAIKDASLALALAKEGGFQPRIAQYTYDMLCHTRDAGYAQNYHPAVIQLIDGRVKVAATGPTVAASGTAAAA
ncbi:NAD(P)-dependent oxidoreductase [Bordetella genomosp. 9]|uniref:2-hydroxy-3-oxopropionate reductase n=1 Tax=Bordetella genomosp. 9 TaxID=1416803 RepID=A0A1W6YZP8_9BORD|nr:NAD(P)-dependent oxidoreductase [Bordetella genomosp. 9]ARP86548.1 2-hydroxy-3-oxopropionate reductase [Bordetella genomosp. 9]